MALLETLNADLLSHDSATLTLERWCGAHQLASPPKIVAERVRGEDKPATPDVRAVLAAAPAEVVRYRRVRLRCGDHIVSEADNWYVPGRLTLQMNQALDATDVAFGHAVQALHFQRHTISVKTLWSPLPEGWEMRAPVQEPATPGPLAIPHGVLEHRAVLTVANGLPISEVVETYTREVLAFPPQTDAAPGP